MKKYFYYLFVFLLTSFLFTSCSSKTEEDQTVVPGETKGDVTLTVHVVDNTSYENVTDAIVTIAGGPEIYELKTDGVGKASITFTNDKSRELTITASKSGFDPQTEKVTVGIEDDETVEVKIQKKTANSDVTGPAASIVLLSQSTPSLGVKESGSIETANILFEVQDSSGNPIDIDHSIFVSFKFGAHPGGGEFLGPDSSKTNGIGQVYVNLNTGYKAGVVQLHAEIQANGTSIRKKIISKPVNISIHGGHPDQAHFSVSTKYLNIHGWSMDGVNDEIMAIAGDKYSNPVKVGTSVYFNTDGGVISGSALTNDNGVGVVNLMSGNPRPTDHPYGPGYFDVRAFSADENQNIVSDKVVVLFSGAPRITITEVDPLQKQIEHLGGKSFTYTIQDVNGNPISSFHHVRVVLKGQGLNVDGDVDFDMPDTQAKGPGATEFGFTVTDTDKENPLGPRTFTASVVVTGPYIGRASTNSVKVDFPPDSLSSQ